ncbi:MAG: type II toxin-antitoxin system VapC family toxin [Candidatus Acidiferrales bacterium]
MKQVIVDASVAAKWLLPRVHEPLANEAAELLTQYTNGELELAVPDLFWAEMGNLLWKAVRLKRCGLSETKIALALLKEYGFPTISSKSLLDLAVSIATAFNRTVYDSLYVSLAVSSKSQLVTADEKLANALAAQMPVKWLGAYF